MTLPALPALFGAVMLLIGVFVCLVSGRHVWRTAALFRADTVDRLGGDDDGRLVRVTGTVEAAGSTLTAPFSGVDCVALRSVVEERRSGAYLLPTYVTIHESARSTAFEVRTPHATLSIADPARTVALDATTVETVALGDDPPDRIARYERDHDVPVSRVSLPRPLEAIARAGTFGTRRYREQRASPGDDVTVVGRVDGGRLDPLVVSTATPLGTLRRLSTTSLAGLLIGVGAIVLGAGLLVVA